MIPRDGDDMVEDSDNAMSYAMKLLPKEYKEFKEVKTIPGTCYSYGTLLEMIRSFSKIQSIKNHWEDLWWYRIAGKYPEHSVNIIDFELYSFEPLQLSEIGIIKQVGMLPVYGLQSILKPKKVQETKGIWYVRRITGIEHKPGDNKNLYNCLDHLDYDNTIVKKEIENFLHSSVKDLDALKEDYTEDSYLSNLISDVIGRRCRCKMAKLSSGLKLYSFQYSFLPPKPYPPLTILENNMIKVLALAKGITAEISSLEYLEIPRWKVYEVQQFYALFMTHDASQFIVRRKISPLNFYCLEHRAIVKLSKVKPKDHFHCALDDCIQISLAIWDGFWTAPLE